MRFYLDESGDFAFPSDRFDAYTQAVVICPDSQFKPVESYVADRTAAWGVPELHGTELTDEQVWEICRFIRAQPLPALVQATDTTAVSLRDIEVHRHAQAAQLQRNLEEWEAAGGMSEEIREWYGRQVMRSPSASADVVQGHT